MSHPGPQNVEMDISKFSKREKAKYDAIFAALDTRKNNEAFALFDALNVDEQHRIFWYHSAISTPIKRRAELQVIARRENRRINSEQFAVHHLGERVIDITLLLQYKHQKANLKLESLDDSRRGSPSPDSVASNSKLVPPPLGSYSLTKSSSDSSNAEPQVFTFTPQLDAVKGERKTPSPEVELTDKSEASADPVPSKKCCCVIL